MKKRLIAALLAVSMLVPSGSALAVRLPEQRTERIYSTSTYINPLYRNEMTAAQLKTTREEDASEGSTQYVTSETELCDQLREDLVQRKSTITLHYQSNTYDKQDAENFFKKAVAHTGKPTEGDYLKWQYAGWKATQSGNVEGNTYYMTIKYTMTWYTTEKQEAVLDAKVKKILQSLKLDGKSDYEKISAIYSYVCSHVTYDSEHDADDSYKLKYTAYAAAINGTCVCQGYSVLLYRLLLEENIDCRFISGTGNGENHSWNIVKLGGKYYNLDATWDAGNEKPIYFLKCNENFTGHVRDSEYKTNAFYRNYPMGDEDYAETQKTHTHTYERPEFEWSSDLLSCIARFFCTLGDDIQQEACTVTVNENGTRTASCTFDGKTYIDQIISDTRRVEDIFTDVPATSWYRDFVQYVYDHALMSGVSETQFQPDGTLTRAQVAQILYNQAENPEVEESNRCQEKRMVLSGSYLGGGTIHRQRLYRRHVPAKSGDYAAGICCDAVFLCGKAGSQRFRARSICGWRHRCRVGERCRALGVSEWHFVRRAFWRGQSGSAGRQCNARTGSCYDDALCRMAGIGSVNDKRTSVSRETEVLFYKITCVFCAALCGAAVF